MNNRGENFTMVDLSNTHLMYIEPQGKPVCCDDSLTLLVELEKKTIYMGRIYAGI